jgi:hypothetical protein
LSPVVVAAVHKWVATTVELAEQPPAQMEIRRQSLVIMVLVGLAQLNLQVVQVVQVLPNAETVPGQMEPSGSVVMELMLLQELLAVAVDITVAVAVDLAVTQFQVVEVLVGFQVL